MKKFSVVTVCYGQETYLRDFLNSLSVLTSNQINCIQVVIVDNLGSVDQANLSNFPFEIKILRPGNIGYLPGLSLGAREALKNTVEFVILCNPDLVFESQLTEGFVHGLERHGVLCPNIIDSDGVAQNPNRMQPFTVLERLVWDLMSVNYQLYRLMMVAHRIKRKSRISISDRNLSPQEGEVFLPHGSCLFVSARALAVTDFFYEDIFLWGEEAIIAGKARRAGLTVYFDPCVTVKHISHTSTGKMAPRSRYLIWRESYKKYRKFLCAW